MYICQRFDLCKDAKEKRPSENLGQVLFGERIESSPYKVCVNQKSYANGIVFIMLPCLDSIYSRFPLLNEFCV